MNIAGMLTLRRRPRPAARPRFFFGWAVVGAAFWVDLLSYGVATVAFGVFFPTMSASLGWGYGLLAGAILLHSVVVALVSPLVGVVVDRRGPRLLIAAGAIGLGLGAAALGLVEAHWQFYVVYGVVMALGHVGLSELVNHTTVAQWFVRRRGRALGFVTMGYSAAGILLPLPLTALIAMGGWRSAWVVLGAATCAIGGAAALVMRRRPEDQGLLPDGDTTPRMTVAPPVPESAADSVRTSAFWLLLLGSNAAGLALFGINVHLISYLYDRGLTLSAAAVVVTVLYTTQMAAKPLWGFLSERLHVRVCLAICYAGGGLGVLLLLLARTPVTVLPFILVYGLTRGAQSLLVSLAWADYFGRGIQGRVRGFAASFRVVATAGGPVLAGVLFDVTGAYTVPFLIFAAMFVLGGGLSYAAKPPRPASSHRPTADATPC